ncbi:hypothetical protein Taro_020382, partial [Colocasia esculenta]|nr:hypothetical protein [Colocasia esculenta]
QSTGAKKVGALKAELQSLKGELGSIKLLVQDLSIFVRAHLPIPTPSAPTPAGSSGPSVEDVRPLGPVDAEQSGPPGPILDGSGPSGPVDAEQSGPSGPVESVAEPARVEDQAVAPEPLSSPLQTPAPPSPPSSSTTPPAPATFKQPLPKHISSPTPFPTASSSSPASSTSNPPPIVEVPPTSSSAGSSSSSPSSSGRSIPPLSISHSFLHPPTPPSFITIIPEGAQLEHHMIHDIKDEFEVAMLHSVLSVGTHLHRTGSSSPAPKKRKISSNRAISSEPHFPPLWFSLSVENRRRPLYCEYLQKCTFATIFGLPYLNLTDHLNVILPFSSLSKAEQSKKISMTEAKTEEQWAQGHKSLYNQFLRAQAARFPPRDHLLTLSEWFQIHHTDTWGSFIQKEIKLIRTNISCKGSVDTPLTSVDTMLQSQAKMLKKWSSSVDTRCSQARSTLLPSSVDTVQPRSTLTSSSVDTSPCLGDSSLGRRLGSSCTCGALHLQNPFYMQGRPHGRLPPLKTAATPPSSLLQPILVLLPFIPSSPSSALPVPLASMAPKQAPRRGARSRATARPIPVEEAPPTERRSKRRHDPVEQPGPSSASPSSSKRGRTPSARGRGSTNPRRRILVSSPEASAESSSPSSGSSHPSEATPSKLVPQAKSPSPAGQWKEEEGPTAHTSRYFPRVQKGTHPLRPVPTFGTF